MDDIEQMNQLNVNKYYDSSYSKIYRSLFYFEKRQNEISSILKESVSKSVLDIGAGDAYWLKYFIDEIDSYTAIEKGSENCHLIGETFYSDRNKIQILNSDAFIFQFSNIYADTLFFGFFISHFHLSSIIELIQKIRYNVHFSRILILDSFWSELRKNQYTYNKLEYRKRRINDDRECIEIPKRFISLEDLQKLSFILKMNLDIKYNDEYWVCALLTKK